MLEQKQRELVERVCERTLAGKLKWERTIEDGVFQVALRGFCVRLRRAPTDSGTHEYVFDVFNDEAVLIDELVVEFAGVQDIPGHELWLKARDAFDHVRRSVLSVDQALEKILQQLG
ncbi:MAG: hypothetical protein HYS13_23440 [Planctomycetia bacterium]|nr:hypothetical protein [Planctomycetia bacterium]